MSLQNTTPLSSQGQSREGKNTTLEIPNSVYEKALQRVVKYVGGVIPPSNLIEKNPPAVTMPMLATLAKQQKDNH